MTGRKLLLSVAIFFPMAAVVVLLTLASGEIYREFLRPRCPIETFPIGAIAADVVSACGNPLRVYGDSSGSVMWVFPGRSYAFFDKSGRLTAERWVTSR